MCLEYPLVSVVIPTYKRSDTIKRAIESVLNQTYKNIEILVIDDNGMNSEYREKTKKNLKKYIEEKKIRYIERKLNGGGSKARNTGIAEAKGEFVAFLDDDDEFLPNKIEKQYRLYAEHFDENIGLIYCYVDGVNNNGEIIERYNNDIEGRPLYESMKGCIAGTSTWFCPLNTLKDIGGFTDTPAKQDTITIIKLISKGYGIYRVPETLLRYFEYKGNKISGVGKNTINGELNARNYARSLYPMLENRNQEKEIEYIYAKKLLTLYTINNMKKDARKQLNIMIKTNPFRQDTFKSAIKYCLSRYYKNYIYKQQEIRFSAK